MSPEMHPLDFSLTHLIKSQPSDPDPDPGPLFLGGLFLQPNDTVPPSFLSLVPPKTRFSFTRRGKTVRLRGLRGGGGGALFFSVSLSIKRSEGNGDDGCVGESGQVLGQNGNTSISSEEAVVVFEKGESETVRKGSGAMNTTKHLWSGAVAAMVSRTFVAPLERLKLEYIVRGEQKNLFELIRTIAASQGLKGFWKGNLVNILRTAPFKAINFYAYDTYRNHLMKLSENEESTNYERFLAGAAAGITATLLCLPMDTIRTKMVAPGGEALGGVIGAFRHMIQTEGFFSLYKGLLPSIVSMAPSGAVFYGVYDVLKSAYLHSPEGRKRIQHMKQEVVRRHLQLQVRATKLSAFATCVKIVEQGGVPALYAGLTPSLLQVLPSAAISYLVYEFMKIFLKVEST